MKHGVWPDIKTTLPSFSFCPEFSTVNIKTPCMTGTTLERCLGILFFTGFAGENR